MRKSFTLLELLVVIIIIGILALIAIPQFFQAADKAREAKAKEIVNNIARVAMQYRAIYGVWPTTSDKIEIDLDQPPDGTPDVKLDIPRADPDYTFSFDNTGVSATKKSTTSSYKNVIYYYDNGQLVLE